MRTTSRVLSWFGVATLLSTLGAVEAKALFEGDEFWIGGRYRQGVAFQYSLPSNQEIELGSINFLGELRGNWSPDPRFVVVQAAGCALSVNRIFHEF